MADYSHVSHQLARVRAAWKRNSAISGAVVLTLEALGIFSLALLIDVLYRPGIEGRVSLLAIAAGAIVYFATRHIVEPLFRRIPDEQIALYVEEHHPEFEGALMSAAEFGRAAAISDKQQSIVSAIIAEAVSRTKRFGLKSSIDFSRLRKYILAAVVAVFLYFALGLLAPQAMARHVSRVLIPWRPTDEDIIEADRVLEEAGPITFSLSAEDARVMRGTPFELDVALSRASDSPVLFHFKPIAGIRARDVGDDALAPFTEDDSMAEGSWRTLGMKEVEKINGYALMLPDVNEDLAFFVSTGEFKTPPYSIHVYDPIRLEGFEVLTTYPEYLGLPKSTEEQPTGDISVLQGSTVTVRILTNSELQEGRLLWADGQVQPLTATSGTTGAVEATFAVEKDRSYNFSVSDIHGQELTSLAPAIVHAIPDGPPTIAIVKPQIDLAVHPLAEIQFVIEAKDDWGVSSVDMIYRVGFGPDAAPKRIPLQLVSKGPEGKKEKTVVEGSLLMFFEDMNPRIKPGEMITYHFQSTDMRKNTAISDIFFIKVMPFEVWSTWYPLPYEEGHGPHSMPASVERYVAAAWHLHSQRESMPVEQYEKACEKLAEQFTSGGTTLWDYVRDPHH